MRRFVRQSINKLLKKFGLIIIRIYEYEHIVRKYNILLKEVNSFFSELIFFQFPINSNRIKLLGKLYGTGVSEALYIIHFLHKSIKEKGDVCEFGVANGATSTLLANEIRASKKNIWLFDSFRGLSKPTKEDILLNDIFKLGSIGKYFGTMSYSIKEVVSRLKNIRFSLSRVKIVPGFIEHSIEGNNLPTKICFAYVDFDLYEPIATALNFIDKRLSKGGFIIIDDYNFFSKGVKTAVDEFIVNYKKNYRVSFPYKFAGNFCILEKLKE